MKLGIRTGFAALVVVVIAIWVMKAAFHLAGAAFRVILFVVVVVALIGWATSAVGRGRAGR